MLCILLLKALRQPVWNSQVHEKYTLKQKRYLIPIVLENPCLSSQTRHFATIMEFWKVTVCYRIGKVFCREFVNSLDTVFTFVCVKKEDTYANPHYANRNHATWLSAVGHITLEWRWNGTFDLTEIKHNHGLKRGIIYQIVRFIFHFFCRDYKHNFENILIF